MCGKVRGFYQPIIGYYSIFLRGLQSWIPGQKTYFLYFPYPLQYAVAVEGGVSHEIVRHRIASYSQESTRYCNYNLDKFGDEITVIDPYFYEKGIPRYDIWKEACENAEESYFKLIALGSPQEARSVLPNSLKTEIAVTYNFRE